MPLTFASASLLAADPRGMSGEQTQDLLSLLTLGTLPVDEGAQLLRAWAARGETSVELFAAVDFLQSHAVRVPVVTPCLDLCGTGGSIDIAVDHSLLQLERSVAAERGVAIDHDAIGEGAKSGAERRFWYDRPRQTNSVLEYVVVRFAEAVR